MEMKTGWVRESGRAIGEAEPDRIREALDALCQESASFGGNLTPDMILAAIERAGFEIVPTGLPVYKATSDDEGR
jgi:hypothetical protein